MANAVYRARQELKAHAARTGQDYDTLSKEYAQIRSARGGTDLPSEQISGLGKNGGANSTVSVSTPGAPSALPGPATTSAPSTLPGPATTSAPSAAGGDLAGKNKMVGKMAATAIGAMPGGKLALGVGGLVAGAANAAVNAVSKATGVNKDQLASFAQGTKSETPATTPTQPDPQPKSDPVPTQSAGNDPFLTGLDDHGDVDYSVQIQQAIDAGAPASEVQALVDKRLQKADEKGYYQYKYDKVYKDAMAYIKAQSGQSGGGASADYDLSGQLKDAAAGQLEADLADLKSAYGKTMDEYDATRDQLPLYYQQAKNQAAAQSAMAKKNFAEQAAASGLNSGASGQAALDASAVYQGALGQLDQSRATALSELDRAKAALTAQYETAVAKAKAEGRSDLARALYQEMVRVQGLERADEATGYSRHLTELERQRLAEQTAYERRRAEEQTSYERSFADRQFAADQVAAILASGNMPSAELLTAAGLSQEYAQGIYDQYQRQEAEKQKAIAQALAEWFAKWGDLSKLKELNVDTSRLTGD